MDVAFLWFASEEARVFSINPGPMALSAYLSRAGFSSGSIPVDLDDSAEDVAARIRQAAPALVAVSVYSISWWRIRRLLRELRPLIDPPIVVGGYHPSLASQDIRAADCCDYLCIGEGEEPLLQLLQSIRAGQPGTPIPGLLPALGARTEDATAREASTDLDALPRWDRDLFPTPFLEAYHLQYFGRVVPIYTGKGCPYGCSFCSNRPFMRLCGTKEVRRRSVAEVIAELEQLQTDHQPDAFFVTDEQFTSSRTWLEAFCQRYARRIGLPFVVLATSSTLGPDILGLLAEAGCLMIGIGVEVGDEDYRKRVLNKPIPNQVYRQAFAACRQRGILTFAAAMIGLPGEDEALLGSTCDFIEELDPDLLLPCVFNPLPGTALRTRAERDGELTTVSSGWIREHFGHQYQNKEFQLLQVDDDAFLRVGFGRVPLDAYRRHSDRLDRILIDIDRRFVRDHQLPRLLEQQDAPASRKHQPALLVQSDPPPGRVYLPAEMDIGRLEVGDQRLADNPHRLVEVAQRIHAGRTDLVMINTPDAARVADFLQGLGPALAVRLSDPGQVDGQRRPLVGAALYPGLHALLEKTQAGQTLAIRGDPSAFSDVLALLWLASPDPELEIHRAGDCLVLVSSEGHTGLVVPGDEGLRVLSGGRRVAIGGRGKLIPLGVAPPEPVVLETVVQTYLQRPPPTLGLPDGAAVFASDGQAHGNGTRGITWVDDPALADHVLLTGPDSLRAVDPGAWLQAQGERWPGKAVVARLPVEASFTPVSLPGKVLLDARRPELLELALMVRADLLDHIAWPRARPVSFEVLADGEGGRLVHPGGVVPLSQGARLLAQDWRASGLEARDFFRLLEGDERRRFRALLERLAPA